MKPLLHALFQGIFWIWNLTFLLVVYGGILPLTGGGVLASTASGEMPIDFVASLAGLVAVPTACAFVGALRLRKQPLQLIRLFYGVEAPLFLLCGLRLFVLRELTPASAVMLGTAVACILAFAAELVYGYAKDNRAIATLQLFAHSLMLLLGTSAGILLLLYAVPAVAFLTYQFFSLSWLIALADLMASGMLWSNFWWVPLLFVLFCFSATLFLAMPSALATFYIHAWYRILKAFGSQYGKVLATAGSLFAMSAWIAIFAALQQQPQIEAFKLLATPPQTDSAKQALLARSETIRKGLTNAYLLPYRYLSTRAENNHIRDIYRNLLSLPPEAARVMQDSYNYLMSPFLFDGSVKDREKAAKLYAEFFDTPIQKAERSAIRHALQSTFDRERVLAALSNINDRKVWLAVQEVTVRERGDWADVELHEVYENQTNSQQAVFYYFSLPESAVITGLWQGSSDNRSERHSFAVSPRKPAQTIYDDDVRELADAGLVEQVAPRQYRLRAFPVPARSQEQEPARLHLWLTYKVMQAKGEWALPRLAEKRNVFWTKATQRSANGRSLSLEKDAWLPEFVPALKPSAPVLHQVNLPEGYRLSAKPLKPKDYSLPKKKRFAVLLDTSLSMADRLKELQETFQWLKEKGFADSSFANGDADVYLSAVAGSKPARVDDLRRFEPAKVMFYGSLQYKDILQQFYKLRGKTRYDAILLVTDAGSYDPSEESKNLPPLSVPLWMVHLGGLPRAYDDALLQAIQDSRGGVSEQLPEVLRRLGAEAAVGQPALNLADGYAWAIEGPFGDILEEELPPEQEGSAAIARLSEKGFEPLAARVLVLALSQQQGLNELDRLDRMHAIAKQLEIVTPYSSMLVLADDRQGQALNPVAAALDRFEPEAVSAQEELSKPFAFAIVPEISAVLLPIAAAFALFLVWLRPNRTVS